MHSTKMMFQSMENKYNDGNLGGSRRIQKAGPNEFWFFYAITDYWYLHVTTRVNKNVMLKTIILSAIKCLKAQDKDFPAVQSLPNPPDAALVHALAQWQSICYDLYCLNQLLLEPLPSLQVSLVLECSNVVKFSA